MPRMIDADKLAEEILDLPLLNRFYGTFMRNQVLGIIQRQASDVSSVVGEPLSEKLANMLRSHLDGVYVFSSRPNCDELVSQLARRILDRPAGQKALREGGHLTIADYEAVLADHRRLVRELDVALHGVEGAAKQASLCDLIESARRLREAVTNALAALEAGSRRVGVVDVPEMELYGIPAFSWSPHAIMTAQGVIQAIRAAGYRVVRSSSES